MYSLSLENLFWLNLKILDTFEDDDIFNSNLIVRCLSGQAVSRCPSTSEAHLHGCDD